MRYQLKNKQTKKHAHKIHNAQKDLQGGQRLRLLPEASEGFSHSACPHCPCAAPPRSYVKCKWIQRKIQALTADSFQSLSPIPLPLQTSQAGPTAGIRSPLVCIEASLLAH